MLYGKIILWKNTDLDLIRGKKFAIIDYSSQRCAYTLNLKDSGVNVTRWLYEGSRSWEKAEREGVKVSKFSDAVKNCDVIMILVPDEKQSKLYN